MGLAGPVTGDADGNEDDGVAGAWEGGDASAAGLSRPRLKYLSIFRCFLGVGFFVSLFLLFSSVLLLFMSGFSQILFFLIVNYCIMISLKCVGSNYLAEEFFYIGS